MFQYNKGQNGVNGNARLQINYGEGIAAGGAFSDALQINHSYGGAPMTGGRNTFEVTSAFTGPPSSPTNPNRNYVGAAIVGRADSGDGGTSPSSSATSQGAIFGINAVAVLNNAATNFLNVSGMEVNIGCRAGSSVWYKTGIQITGTPDDAVQGEIHDAALSISGQIGAIGFKTGILFTAANGQQGVNSGNGTLIAAIEGGTAVAGIDFNSYTFTQVAFRSRRFQVGPQGDTSLGDNSLAAANPQPLYFASGGNPATSWDVRIQATGGTGALGQGALEISAGSLTLTGLVTTTSATVGGASALPGVPDGYLTVKFGVNTKKIAYWNP